MISARIEYVPAKDLLDEPVPTTRARAPVFSVRRQVATAGATAAALALLTLLLKAIGDGMSIEGQVMLYLLVAVGAAAAGGVLVAVPAALVSALVINYEFVEPRHTLSIAHADQAVALVVFAAVASVVSGAVEIAIRRARSAEQAREQADILSSLTGGETAETVHEVLAKARSTFAMQTVALKARVRPSGEWVDVETAGWAPQGDEQPLVFDVPIGSDLRMVGRGPMLFAEDQRVLRALAGAAQIAYENARLSERAEEARVLSEVDRQRTSLLAAVSHDLRTPLASIKAAASTLRQPDIALGDGDRAALLATIEESTDNLDAIVTNLLDASRLEAGTVSVRLEPVAVDEVVSAAVLSVPEASGRVVVSVDEDLPAVLADRGLLERALANLIDNALRHGNNSASISAFATEDSVRLEVVDHGPGVPAAERDQLFEPFRRLDDSTTGGVGLGLSVVRGFVAAMNGAVVADATPGGGLTMRMRLPSDVGGTT